MVVAAGAGTVASAVRSTSMAAFFAFVVAIIAVLNIDSGSSCLLPTDNNENAKNVGNAYIQKN